MSGEGVSLELPETQGPSGRDSLFEPSRQTNYASPPVTRREQSASSRMREPGDDELRKAVIWAEILGQPRAKRPFRRP
jgi:hypothetical protein